MAQDWKDLLGTLGTTLPDPPQSDDEPVKPAKPVKRSVTLFYETKGRAGKPATILADFVGVSDDDIADLASELKRALGTGGSVRGGEILIQGDRRRALRPILQKKGFTVKG